jgi:hypothetical protein
VIVAPFGGRLVLATLAAVAVSCTGSRDRSPSLQRSPASQPHPTATTTKVDAEQYRCQRDEDCVITCANGALNREWSTRHAHRLQMCLDGCQHGAGLPRCEQGICTAMRGGKPDPSCTRRELRWLAGAAGAAADQSARPAAVTSSDPTLSPTIVESWGPQKTFFRSREFTIVDWGAAKTLLRQKTYRGGKQYHSGWVSIYTRDGKSYLTHPPRLDDFFQFMQAAKLSTAGFAPE